MAEIPHPRASPPPSCTTGQGRPFAHTHAMFHVPCSLIPAGLLVTFRPKLTQGCLPGANRQEVCGWANQGAATGLHFKVKPASRTGKCLIAGSCQNIYMFTASTTDPHATFLFSRVSRTTREIFLYFCEAEIIYSNVFKVGTIAKHIFFFFCQPFSLIFFPKPMCILSKISSIWSSFLVS